MVSSVAALQSLPDTQLERIAADGNGDAFGVLADRYLGIVHDYVRRMVGDIHVAEDLAQDAFEFAWRNLKPDRPRTKQFKGFILDIAYQRASNYFRRHRQAVPFPVIGEENDELWQPAEDRPYADPQQSAEIREAIALVRRVMATLDSDDRELLTLRYHQMLSPQEMAARLGVNRNAMDQRLHRTNRRFAEAYLSLAMFERGSKKCPDLARLLQDAGAVAGSVEATSIILGHERRCAVCKEERKRLRKPESVFGAIALAPVSLLLRQRMAEAAWQSVLPGGAAASAGGSAGTATTAGTAGGGITAGGAVAGGGIISAVTSAIGVVVGNGLVQLVLGAAAIGGVAAWTAGVDLPLAPASPFGTQGGRSARLPCTPVDIPRVGDSAPETAYASAILAASNEYRTERASPPLPEDGRLQAAAAEYARFVVETRWWLQPQAQGAGIHLGADCRDEFDRVVAQGFPRRVVGENVMWSTTDVAPADQFAALLAGAHEDPTNPAFERTGVACFVRQTPPAERVCVQVFAGGP